jgi:hypothetical protein
VPQVSGSETYRVLVDLDSGPLAGRLHTESTVVVPSSDK